MQTIFIIFIVFASFVCAFALAVLTYDIIIESRDGKQPKNTLQDGGEGSSSVEKQSENPS